MYRGDVAARCSGLTVKGRRTACARLHHGTLMSNKQQRRKMRAASIYSYRVLLPSRLYTDRRLDAKHAYDDAIMRQCHARRLAPTHTTYTMSANTDGQLRWPPPSLTSQHMQCATQASAGPYRLPVPWWRRKPNLTYTSSDTSRCKRAATPQTPRAWPTNTSSTHRPHISRT